MKVRTIRDVDEETWKRLKELAKMKKVKMGVLLRILVREYRKFRVEEFIPKKPILSKNEANELKAFLKELRREYGFRL